VSVAEQFCSWVQRWCALSAQACAALTPPLAGPLPPPLVHATTTASNATPAPILMARD
jgi:hypothetical protein